MSSLHLLLPILLLAGGVKAWTNFEFTGQLICARPEFRYHIVVYEDDIIYDNVISLHIRTNNVYSQPHYYKETARDDDDGVARVIDGYFEIFFKILHNCTSDRKYKLLVVDIGKFAINDGLHQVVKHITLTNAGDATTQTFPRLKLFDEMEDVALNVSSTRNY